VEDDEVGVEGVSLFESLFGVYPGFAVYFIVNGEFVDGLRNAQCTMHNAQYESD
jgi:hypothetical protein